MPDKIKLTYFDFHGGRGEPVRLALTIGGVAFEDDRVVYKDWAGRKPATPFGGLPLLEVNGKRISQSNAILRYAGRLAGLYPTDPWQAAIADQICDAVEEYYAALSTTYGLAGEELAAARKKLVEGKLPFYLKAFEKLLQEQGGQWFAEGRLTIADLKVSEVVRQLRSGKLDHIPTDVVRTLAPALDALHDRVLAHPAVAEYYAKRAR